jgi:hypothetical protein
MPLPSSIGVESFSAAAIRRSSSANSSCWISRSIFSEDLPTTWFFSSAMRSRRVWINWLWAAEELVARYPGEFASASVCGVPIEQRLVTSSLLRTSTNMSALRRHIRTFANDVSKVRLSTPVAATGFARAMAQVDCIPVIHGFDHKAIWE